MEFESYRTKLNLPEPLHLIVSLEHADSPDIRAYRIQDSQVTEISIQQPFFLVGFRPFQASLFSP